MVRRTKHDLPHRRCARSRCARSRRPTVRLASTMRSISGGRCERAVVVRTAGGNTRVARSGRGGDGETPPRRQARRRTQGISSRQWRGRPPHAASTAKILQYLLK